MNYRNQIYDVSYFCFVYLFYSSFNVFHLSCQIHKPNINFLLNSSKMRMRYVCCHERQKIWLYVGEFLYLQTYSRFLLYSLYIFAMQIEKIWRFSNTQKYILKACKVRKIAPNVFCLINLLTFIVVDSMITLRMYPIICK